MTDDLAPGALLRSAALRVTVQRIAVLQELGANPHADVDTIVGGVREALGRISTQAVYDVLRALTDAGLVRRIEPAGSPARYELHFGPNYLQLPATVRVSRTSTPTRRTARWPSTTTATPRLRAQQRGTWLRRQRR